MVSSSPLEGELTGYPLHICYCPDAQYAQKGSGEVRRLTGQSKLTAIVQSPLIANSHFVSIRERSQLLSMLSAVTLTTGSS